MVTVRQVTHELSKEYHIGYLSYLLQNGGVRI